MDAAGGGRGGGRVGFLIATAHSPFAVAVNSIAPLFHGDRKRTGLTGSTGEGRDIPVLLIAIVHTHTHTSTVSLV